MPNTFNALTHDYSDCPLDIEPHREALKAFDRYAFDKVSVYAALRARDLVFRRIQQGGFRIDCSDDVENTRMSPMNRPATVFEVLHHTSAMREARLVRYEVERYFMGHFPGRCLNKLDDSQPKLDRGTESVVYLVLFPPGLPPNQTGEHHG